MAHVDALSRQIAYVNTLPLEREFEIRQTKDSRLMVIAKELEYGVNEKFKLIDGLVYQKGDDRSRFVVPDSLIINVIRAYHDEMAHYDFKKTFQGISSNYWFPSMRKRIFDHIDNVIVCILANASTHARESELQLSTCSTKPFEVLHIDHFGLLQLTEDGCRHILVIIDAFTRFTWLFAMKTTSIKETLTHLTTLFNISGNTAEIVTDRGTAFTSKEFENFVKSYKVKLQSLHHGQTEW